MKSRGLVFGMGSAAVGSLGMGMYKMLAYENTGFIEGSVNSYVGSDAENFIINANLSAAWFTLFAAFLVGTFLAEILYHMHQNRNPVKDLTNDNEREFLNKTQEIQSTPPSNNIANKITTKKDEERKGFMDWIFDL